MTKAPRTFDEWPPAGALRRVPATILDIALYVALCALLAVPVSHRFDWSIAGAGIEKVARAATEPSWLGHASGIVGLWIALWWCYFVVGWGLLGATPGKWACGLRIIDHRRHCPIGPVRAVLRLAAYSVSSVTLGWGHLLVILRTDRRALHDILAGTRVVRKPRRGNRKIVPEPKEREEVEDEERERVSPEPPE
ncbi:MAG: RDD family protein [Thermoanaerobaculales bacterium]